MAAGASAQLGSAAIPAGMRQGSGAIASPTAAAAAGAGRSILQQLWQQQPAQQPQPQQLLQTQQPQDPRVKRFMARVRLTLLDSCQSAVLVQQQLVQEKRASSRDPPIFPLEKLHEAYTARWGKEVESRRNKPSWTVAW
jgi:hypothetical protein